MIDPVSSNRLTPLATPQTSRATSTESTSSDTGFTAQLREQLEQVSRMQAEADQGVQSLLTGQTDNITEVFTTARKAEVAFSLLMEIRNKLVDAYSELRQLRV